MSGEKWRHAYTWVDTNQYKILGYVRNHHLLAYSAYEMQDFIAEAYLIAYEALSCDAKFDACFWVLFKNRCKTVLANKPHINKECCHDLGKPNAENDFTDPVKEISALLPYLTEPQKEIIELIIETSGTVGTLAKTLNISRQAVQQRIRGTIKIIHQLKRIPPALSDGQYR